MNEFMETRNEKYAASLIKAFERRHMKAFYARDGRQALTKVMELIPDGAKVANGGTMTAAQIGVFDALREREKRGEVTFIDRSKAVTPEERRAVYLQSFDTDVYIMGTNAFSEDGQLVNIDGNGNRLAALLYGPKSVIVLASMDKAAATLEDAIARARHTAAPINAQRFDIHTPCKVTGMCGNCNSPDSICNNIVITRNDSKNGRIKVILIGETLGF